MTVDQRVTDTHHETHQSEFTVPPSLPSPSRPNTSPLDGTASVRATPIRIQVAELNPWVALTAVVSRLRPDWTPEAIQGALRDCGLPPRDVVRVAVDLALDPETRHPGRIASYDPRKPTPVVRAERCPVDKGVRAHDCGGAECRGCNRKRPAPADALARCRAAIATDERPTPEEET